jgi:hypothetical protein
MHGVLAAHEPGQVVTTNAARDLIGCADPQPCRVLHDRERRTGTRRGRSICLRSAKIVATLAVYSVMFAATQAVADAEPTVPCAALDQITESLDNDISAGIAGVRTVISSPYLSGGMQQRDAADKLNMVSHGVHYMQDINAHSPIAGLAPLLDSMDRTANDMKDAVSSLFTLSGGQWSYGASVSLAFPQQGTWETIDYADQKKNELYEFVNPLRGRCTS